MLRYTPLHCLWVELNRNLPILNNFFAMKQPRSTVLNSKVTDQCFKRCLCVCLCKLLSCIFMFLVRLPPAHVPLTMQTTGAPRFCSICQLCVALKQLYANGNTLTQFTASIAIDASLLFGVNHLLFCFATKNFTARSQSFQPSNHKVKSF